MPPKGVGQQVWPGGQQAWPPAHGVVPVAQTQAPKEQTWFGPQHRPPQETVPAAQGPPHCPVAVLQVWPGAQQTNGACGGGGPGGFTAQTWPLGQHVPLMQASPGLQQLNPHTWAPCWVGQQNCVPVAGLVMHTPGHCTPLQFAGGGGGGGGCATHWPMAGLKHTVPPGQQVGPQQIWPTGQHWAFAAGAATQHVPPAGQHCGTKKGNPVLPHATGFAGLHVPGATG